MTSPADAPDLIEVRSTLVVTRLSDGGDPRPGEVPLILDHPAVSRRHARFSRENGKVKVVDEQSTNGTFVNRRRVNAAVLEVDDVVEIGPFRLLFNGAGLIRLSRGAHAALQVRGVARDVIRREGNRAERILQPISLSMKPGRVMCIVGASGSGKSTLLNIMAGRLNPSAGSVSFGGLDLHANFAALKQDIAYLPQSETVHELLTVREALRYAARLRLPREMSEAAREAAIVEAVNAVGLQERIDVPIVSLSGGQRKRACLACEILARPSLLFLDEATSGLDEVTDREVMALLKRLSREGMSIVCVTHTLANLQEYCDDLVVLAGGGHLAFHGSVAGALQHFRAATLGEVLGELNDGPVKAWPAAAVPDAPARSPGAAAPRAARAQSLAELLHQGWVLLHRNVNLLAADRRALLLAVIQSVVLGTLLGYAFSNLGEFPQRAGSERAVLLLLCVTSLWMGCNSSSKDIVGEWPVFRREHDVNLSTLSFVLSKFAVTGVFAILQLLLLMLLLNVLIEAVPGGTWPQLPALVLSSLCGVGLGLVISSFCSSRDQANIIVPLAVAPQLILGGGLAPLPEPALLLARWTTSAYHVRTSLEGVAQGPEIEPVSLLPAVIQLIVSLVLAIVVTSRRARL
jgi:ABC transport system ATP-binding/permease protein